MTQVEVLMVEDNPGDVLLTQEAMKNSKVLINLNVVEDGVAALDYLHCRGKYEEARRPDLILLDLNLPKKDGREVLAEIKADSDLGLIPVVVLTTSLSDEDVLKTYGLHANCYMPKPVDFDLFRKVVRGIEDFWFTLVKLPPKTGCRG